jgi:hypothetical protein
VHVANGVRLIHLNSWVVFISLGLRSWVAKKMAVVHVLLRVDLLVSRNSCDHSEMVFMKPMLSGSVLSVACFLSLSWALTIFWGCRTTAHNRYKKHTVGPVGHCSMICPALLPSGFCAAFKLLMRAA